jgi:hypothetical protein
MDHKSLKGHSGDTSAKGDFAVGKVPKGTEKQSKPVHANMKENHIPGGGSKSGGPGNKASEHGAHFDAKHHHMGTHVPGHAGGSAHPDVWSK